MSTTDPKPLIFVGSSHRDLKSFPADVQREVGFALHLAQVGEKSADAKPLQGYRGAGVLEVVENYDGDTYRAVYTVRFADVVYVLHCFQKKSKSGIKTDQRDLDLIQQRLREAETGYHGG